MANRVDFFQSESSKLSIAAVKTEVFYDGCFCPYLEPVDIVRGSWPEFGRARIRVNRTAGASAETNYEQTEFKPEIGRSVCVKNIYSKGTSLESFPIFSGKIEKIESRLNADGSVVEIIARDFSAELERITVYGQWIAKDDGTVLFLNGAETIFNEAAEPNACGQPVLHNARNVRLFSAELLKSRLWSCAEIINYLLVVYLPAGRLQLQPIERLEALTERQRVYDLDVTGISLLDALHRCCERAAVAFKFVQRIEQTGPRQTIVFYKKQTGRAVELNCQRDGGTLSISKTQVSALVNKKQQTVTHRYIGRGEFKRFEATFELVKGWDAALEETDYDKFSASGNPQFMEVKDVYRKWVLNEAGDYSEEPYNQGDAYDFSEIFGTSSYICRGRRFWPALSCDSQGKSMGYFLEVSYDNGEHWWQYLGAFENRLDECAIWLSSDRLDINTWVAALKGVLKFRLTASVVSDERLSCEISDGPVNSVTPVVDSVITLPRQFKYRKVTGKSIFANSKAEGLGQADEADDGKALYEYVRKKASLCSDAIEEFDVRTLHLLFDCRVGDVVTSSPESKDLFGVRADNRSIARIERVRMDFDGQFTKLTIKKQRKSFL